MNVLVLSHMFPNKSAPSFGVFVLEQVRALDKLKINIEVISPTPYSPKILWFNNKWKGYGNIPLAEIIDGKKIFHPRYMIFPMRILFEKSGWNYYLGIRKTLREILNKTEINLIHANTALPDGQAAEYVKEKFGIPFVVTIHGDDLYNTIHQNSNRKNAINKVLIESEKVIVVSNKLKLLIKENFPNINQEKISVINNGVDLGKFKFKPRKFPKKKNFIILSVGSLIKRKGHKLILDILGKLLKNYSIRYHIVGDGEQRDELEKNVQENKLDNVVTFFNNKPYEKIPQFMKEADLFVLPSWDEAFGVVYLEAMAFGLPVIGCKGQGIEDFVEDGKQGLLVEPKNSDDLYKACEKILSNQRLYEQMSEKAVEVASKYTWKKNAERTLQMYKQVLGKKITVR